MLPTLSTILRSSLFYKVFLAILTPILLYGTLTYGVLINTVTKNIETLALEGLENRSFKYQQQMDNRLLLIQERLRYLAIGIGEDFNLNEYNQGEDEYLIRFRNHIAPRLKGVLTELTDIHGIYYMTAPGYGSRPSQVWFNYSQKDNQYQRILEYPDPEDFSPQNPDMRYYYSPLIDKEPYWSAPYTDLDINLFMVSYTLPVFHNNQIIGILGVDFTTEDFRSQVSKMTHQKSGYAFLTSPDMRIIYHPAYPEGTYMRDIPDEASDKILTELKLNRFSGILEYQYTGRDKYLAYARLKNGWVLSLSTYREEILIPLYNLKSQIFEINIFLLIIACIVSYLFSRTVTTPLRQLRSVVEEGSHQRVPFIQNKKLLYRKDEIGLLARTYNAQEVENKAILKRLVDDNLKLSIHKDLGSLVSQFSHDLQTPIGLLHTLLSKMEDSLKNLRQGYDDKGISKRDFEDFINEMEEISQIGQNNINRTNELVSSFKKVVISQSRLEPELFSLNEQLKDIKNSLTHELENHKVDLAILQNENIYIQSHPGYLSQVMINLIQNSIIHGFTNKDQGVITIETQKRISEVQIIYTDNGSGIPPEIAPRIFHPYFTSAKDRGGTGLGLAIVHELVTKNLKGHCSHDSQYNQGARFRITLPLTID